MLTHAASVLGLPFFHLGSIGPIQSFGVIVAAGVLIGAALLRRYAEWHGVPDEQIRGLTGWVTVAGFAGAHLFDVLFYQWHDLVNDPILLVQVWKGISSYGGFIGGAIGFVIYVWWKRLPVRLFADITIVGLLPAFSIGRIACTAVSDHIGAAVDPNKWYAAIAMNYPVKERLGPITQLVNDDPKVVHDGIVTAWNLGLVEFLYLVPVNLLILWLAFRPSKRLNAGLITALTGLLYAPVRFFLDYLRPAETDPPYLGLTFAQWSSIAAFAVALYAVVRVMQNGKPAAVVAATSGEAQRKLSSISLKDDEDEKSDKADKKDDKADLPAAKVESDKSADAGADEEDADDDEEDGDEDAEKPAEDKPADKLVIKKPAPNRSGQQKKSGKNKKKRR